MSKNRRRKHIAEIPTIQARPKHNDGYVIVKLSHPKRKFNEKNTKDPKSYNQNLGYIKQKKFRIFSNNPKASDVRYAPKKDLHQLKISYQSSNLPQVKE